MDIKRSNLFIFLPYFLYFSGQVVCIFVHTIFEIDIQLYEHENRIIFVNITTYCTTKKFIVIFSPYFIQYYGIDVGKTKLVSPNQT